MAEFMFKDILSCKGLSDVIIVESRATSTEEIGNLPHHGALLKLAQYGIVPFGKTAVQLTRSDGEKYDLIIGMDDANIRNILRIVGDKYSGKVKKLLSFAGSDRSIADPWYTNNFDETYEDIKEGLDGLVTYLGI
jgi:protein-tyrosine phosphatase